MSWLLAPSQEQLFKNEELLATAVVRKKIEFAIAKCGLEPGKTVLEIGPGWGAFTAYALHARGGQERARSRGDSQRPLERSSHLQTMGAEF